jgi:hypothetical protein
VIVSAAARAGRIVETMSSRRYDPPRGRALIAIVLLTIHLSGCFQYVPVGAAPVPPGTLVSLAINDRGRVALEDRLGPGVRRIRGTLSETTDSSIVVSLHSIEFADLNIAARMDGESVGIQRQLVAEFRERRLSRTRSWLAAGLVTGGIILVSFIGIGGFGGDDPSDRPNGGGGGENH